MAEQRNMADNVRLLEEEFSRNPLKASVVIQALEDNKSEHNTDQDEATVTGNEQYMKIKVDLPSNLTEVLNSSNEKTHLILVADRSGSMSGNPWSQVRQALLDVVADSIGNDSLLVDIVIYDSDAQHVNYNADNFRDVIGKINAGGSTNFNAAFLMVDKVIAKKSDGVLSKVVVLFLTDGHDTSGSTKNMENTQNWRCRLQSLEKEVIVHTVGFSSSHDYHFLQRLSDVGSVPGMFRYCESGDGPSALKAKLQELFEFVSLSSGSSANLQIKMAGEDRVVGLGVVEQVATIQGEITEKSEGVLSIVAETWIYLKEKDSLPKPEILFIKTLKKDKESHDLKIAVTVESLSREMVTTAIDKTEWAMRILHRNTDILTTKFADTITKKGDLGKLTNRLNRLQNRLSKTSIFGKGITKEIRELLIDHIKEIQAKIDMMHSMLARYLRGETDSVSMLARAHDLRYEAKFSKNRRQRLMDKRVSKNMSKVKDDQNKLKTLSVSKSEIDQLSQDARDFYFCVLSMNSIKDILTNEEEAENVIGFGLAVKRPEHALDDPTSTRIQVISGTLVSRTSMFDALEYKISVEGHLNAHGGFEFSDPLGCATVGMSREPINAWLPLYVNKSHWERVKVLLKPTLGYFCTLDPLGYDFKQMDVLFMVLGNMIGQLNDASAGEHQIRLLFALQRMCAATVFDYELLAQTTTVLKNFIEGPEGRTKDVISNLCTLIGYIVAMPTSITRPLLGYDKKEKHDKLPDKARAFWLSFTTECLRRAGGSMFREASEARLNGVIDHLLHAKGPSSSKISRETTLAHLVEQCSCLKSQETSEIKVKVPDYDPAAEVKPPAVELKHCLNVDKAMDVWAQAKCGIITNKNRDEQVSRAKKVVEQWLREGRQQAGVDEGGATASCDQEEGKSRKDDSFDFEDADSAMIEIIAKLLERLSRASFPHMSAFPGFIAFVHYWLSCDRNYIQMDENGGLAPDEWISEVKSAVTDAYSRMNRFECDCETEAKNSDIQPDPDTLVVMVTNEQLRQGNTDAGQTEESIEGETTVEREGKNDEINSEAAENDDDDDFDDYYDDYDDDEDHENKIKQRQKAVQRHVSVPMILHIIESDMNQMCYIRAALIQAVEFYSNSKARAAAKEGKLKDLCQPDNAAITLCEFHTSLEQRKDSALKLVVDKALWKRANFSMLQAETTWAFIGYLMNTYKERDEGFSELVAAMTSCENRASIPRLVDKLRVMLFGKWEDCSVIANGNMWLPEKKQSQKFKDLVGIEVWDQIEVDLHSNIQIHVYRESDLPNRHGHCNSNPYIPNILRKKLGMELLQEEQTKVPGSRRDRRNRSR